MISHISLVLFAMAVASGASIGYPRTGLLLNDTRIGYAFDDSAAVNGAYSEPARCDKSVCDQETGVRAKRITAQVPSVVDAETGEGSKDEEAPADAGYGSPLELPALRQKVDQVVDFASRNAADIAGHYTTEHFLDESEAEADAEAKEETQQQFLLFRQRLDEVVESYAKTTGEANKDANTCSGTVALLRKTIDATAKRFAKLFAKDLKPAGGYEELLPQVKQRLLEVAEGSCRTTGAWRSSGKD